MAYTVSPEALCLSIQEVEEVAQAGWENTCWLTDKNPKSKTKGKNLNFLLGRLHGAISEEVDGFSVDRDKMQRVLEEYFQVHL